MTRGIVKFWKEDKGWGAIASDEIPRGRGDVFAHFSAIEAEGFRSLEAGDEVEFTWHEAPQDSFEFVADSVTRVDPSTLTLTLDPGLLRRAEAIAQERGDSLPDLLRRWLADYANQ